MITKAQIIRVASREGVPARTVERDYVLAHIVAAIAETNRDESSMLVFKGGSALRMCHVESCRYSADLDFSIVGGCLEDARERTLKLDLADDEIVVHTERRVLLPRWPDLPADVSVHVYTLLEIAAENPLLVALANELRSHAQSSLRGRCAKVLQGGFVGPEWYRLPVPADLAVPAMLDGVPLGCAGWIVTHRHRQLLAVTDLGLQTNLPVPWPRTVPAAPIGQDQQTL